MIDFAERVPYKYVVDLLNLCKKLDIRDIRLAEPAPTEE